MKSGVHTELDIRGSEKLVLRLKSIPDLSGPAVSFNKQSIQSIFFKYVIQSHSSPLSFFRGFGLVSEEEMSTNPLFGWMLKIHILCLVCDAYKTETHNWKTLQARSLFLPEHKMAFLSRSLLPENKFPGLCLLTEHLYFHKSHSHNTVLAE